MINGEIFGPTKVEVVGPPPPALSVETLSKRRRSRGRGSEQEDFYSDGIEVDSIWGSVIFYREGIFGDFSSFVNF